MSTHEPASSDTTHRPLSRLDMTARVDKKAYHDRLKAAQSKLVAIQQAYLHQDRRAVVVFEGWDAAGKGGAIRRMSSVMDPRGFKVWPIAAPDERERRQHYLVRFWSRIPALGEICVFDRSWYGRLLVERVEGFAKPSEWGRAYNEINEFERILVDDGMRIVKIFLYITPEVQAERFRARMEDPLKRWKLSYEDFRNRDRWDDYENAANEMIERTSTSRAPWLVLPANQKRYARVEALEAIVASLGSNVDLDPPAVSDRLKEEYEAMKRENDAS